MLLVFNVQANTIEEDEVDADFLEFLAEVDEATGDGFEIWLKADTNADNDQDILHNNNPK